MDLEYPELAKEEKVLKYLYDTGGGGSLEFSRRRWPKKSLIRREVKKPEGLYHRGEEVSNKLGLSPDDMAGIIRRLGKAGYVSHYIHYYSSPADWDTLGVRFVTEKGLRRLGELPDPQREFMERLEAAIQEIRADDRLSEGEKQKKIDWLEEGKLLARTLTTEAIKALIY